MLGPMGDHTGRATSARARLCAVFACLLVAGLAGLPHASAATGQTVQNGTNNYAGPNCPGTGWLCTKSTANVVQTSSGGQNVFACIDARKTAKQSCIVEQTNTSGENSVNVRQSTRAASSEASAKQRALQGLTITQHNQAGHNVVDIAQSVTQSIDQKKKAKTTSHSQSAFQLLDLHQDSTSGNQDLTIHQDQDLSLGAVATKHAKQLQNATVGDRANQDIKLFQHTQTGQQTATIDQQQSLTQHAKGPQAFQRQGFDDGGEFLFYDIDATDVGGHSTATIDQAKTWTQNADTPSIGKDQAQIDKLRIRMVGLSPDDTTVHQTSGLTTDPDGTQRCTIEGDGLHTKSSGDAMTTCTLDDNNDPPKTETENHPISTDPNSPTSYSDEEVQNPPLGGNVSNDAAENVSGATVQVVPFVHGERQQPFLYTTTDGSGDYRFLEIPLEAATATVRAGGDGYATSTAKVDFRDGPVNQDFTLSGISTAPPAG